MTADPMPGRTLVTRRAVRDLVRNATLSVYGVTGLAGGGPLTPVLDWLGVPHPGLRVVMDGGFVVELHLTVAYGLPVAEVARQVEASVRYAVRHALDREPDRVVIRIAGLRSDIGGSPPHGPHASSGVADQLADSGTDVA